MSVDEVLDIVLPVAYVLVFVALIWFIIELVFTVRRSRAIIIDTKKKLDPTLEHVETITASLQPVAAKIDPLVERVSLTVDATNLEIMRLDQILEDVNEITETISSAASAVDHAANAPLELVNSVTARVRNAFKPRRASSESVALGDQKSAFQPFESAQQIEEEPFDEPRYAQEAEAKQETIPQHLPSIVVSSEGNTAAVASEEVSVVSNTNAVDMQDRYFTYSSQQVAEQNTAQASQTVSPPRVAEVSGAAAGSQATGVAQNQASSSPWPVSIPVPMYHNQSENTES